MLKFKLSFVGKSFSLSRSMKTEMANKCVKNFQHKFHIWKLSSALEIKIFEKETKEKIQATSEPHFSHISSEPHFCYFLSEPHFCHFLSEPHFCYFLSEPHFCYFLSEPHFSRISSELHFSRISSEIHFSHPWSKPAFGRVTIWFSGSVSCICLMH